MPRKRMIDPEFWSDEEIGSWSYTARLLYIGLWNFADDEGRLKAHNELLKSQVFPYDKRINIAKLKHEIGNKVVWYEVNGSVYGHIKNFLKYQKIDRPTTSKLPPPPEIDDGSMFIPRRLAANIKEVNIKEVNISKGESKFEVFWESYPKKQKERATKEAWMNLSVNEQLFKKIMSGLARWKKSEQWKEPRYIPTPDKFLIEERWNDVVVEGYTVEKEIEKLRTKGDL